MENDHNSRRGGKGNANEGSKWNRVKKKKMKEGLKEYTRKQPYRMCLHSARGNHEREALDQSFSTSAHHDIGLPYIHLRLLHPPTFSRLVHLKCFRPLLLAAGCQSFQVGQSPLLWARSRNRSATLILEFCLSRSLTTSTRFSLDRSTFFSFLLLVMLLGWIGIRWHFFFFERKAGGKNFAPSLTPFQLLRSIRIFDFRGQCNGRFLRDANGIWRFIKDRYESVDSKVE